MHYIALLLHRGYEPYREIRDMNLPGCYLPDWIAWTLFSQSSAAWRIYDLVLVLTISLAFFVIAGRERRTVALWASAFVILMHVRDGIAQAGQRDLLGIALVMVGLALLVNERASNAKHSYPLVEGMFFGWAALLKPSLLLLALIPIVCPPEPAHERRRIPWTIGLLLPLGIACAWLLRHHAGLAFIHALLGLGTLHASLGRARCGFLFHNSISSIQGLLLFALIALAILCIEQRRYFFARKLQHREKILALAAVLGFVSYITQQKGFIYHRYPLVVPLLLLICLFFEESSPVNRLMPWMWTMAIAWTAFYYAPHTLRRVAAYRDPEVETVRLMVADIELSANTHQLSMLDGKIQCLDTINGCLGALGTLNITQATGQLYDEFLFNEPTNPAVLSERSRLISSLEYSLPNIIVVTDDLFPIGPDNYRKLQTWPELQILLEQNYSITLTRSPAVDNRRFGDGQRPAGYRIYSLRK